MAGRGSDQTRCCVVTCRNEGVGAPQITASKPCSPCLELHSSAVRDRPARACGDVSRSLAFSSRSSSCETAVRGTLEISYLAATRNSTDNRSRDTAYAGIATDCTAVCGEPDGLKQVGGMEQQQRQGGTAELRAQLGAMSVVRVVVVEVQYSQLLAETNCAAFCSPTPKWLLQQ